MYARTAAGHCGRATVPPGNGARDPRSSRPCLPGIMGGHYKGDLPQARQDPGNYWPSFAGGFGAVLPQFPPDFAQFSTSFSTGQDGSTFTDRVVPSSTLTIQGSFPGVNVG